VYIHSVRLHATLCLFIFFTLMFCFERPLCAFSRMVRVSHLGPHRSARACVYALTYFNRQQRDSRLIHLVSYSIMTTYRREPKVHTITFALFEFSWFLVPCGDKLLLPCQWRKGFYRCPDACRVRARKFCPRVPGSQS
jgi:hypothetical protein